MKKTIYTLLLVSMIWGFNNAYSQSGDQIYKEANPDPVVMDYSPMAQLKQQIYDAKKQGNVVLHKQLTEQFAQQYPHKVRNNLHNNTLIKSEIQLNHLTN